MAISEMQELPSWEQMQEMTTAVRAIAASMDASTPEVLDESMGALLNGTNTTAVFYSWLARAKQTEEDRYKLLVRFGRMLAGSCDSTYMVRKYDPSVSSDSTLTPMDDLGTKDKPRLYTEMDQQVPEWIDEDPMTWYVRANALSLADGTMDVKAIEGEDGFDVSGELAPVYSFTLALYVREYGDGQYGYKSFRTKPAAGYEKRAEAIAPDGTRRVITWHPSFPGGLSSKGGLTSGAGLKPYNFASPVTGLQKARITSPYEGEWSDQDTTWILDMWHLRHWDLENSGIAEGCTNYNLQYQVAAAETGVKRVLLTAAQAAGFIVGSTVSVGDRGSNTNNDRGNAYMRNLADLVRITSIEEVTVSGTKYTALNLDISSAITTTATTWVSTMPWYSGATEAIKGHKDGALISLTGGKGPIRIAGVEMMHGAYDIGLDPLYNVTMSEDGSKTIYAAKECKDSTKLSGSITADYTDTSVTGEYVKNAWNYVKKFAPNKKGILLPSMVGGSSAGWYKSAFLSTASAGVRTPWRFATLNYGGLAGLACAAGNSASDWAIWSGRPRLSGAGKMRGELQA